jgi:hypothetical protein
MEIKEFWKIIDDVIVKQHLTLNQQISEIEIELSNYSIEEIKEFNYLIEQLMEKAKDEKVFSKIASAFKNQIIFEGAVSWSNYEFFIGWLIMQGSEFFNLGLTSPNSLKDLIDNIYNSDINKCICEEAIFIATKAYEIKTGKNYFE